MTEDESKKDVVVFANARLPAESPRALKDVGISMCGRVPADSEILVAMAGRVPQEIPKAISQTKIVDEIAPVKTVEQNQQSKESAPIENSE